MNCADYFPLFHGLVCFIGQIGLYVGVAFFVGDGKIVASHLRGSVFENTLKGSTEKKLELICASVAIPLVLDLIIDIFSYHVVFGKGQGKKEQEQKLLTHSKQCLMRTMFTIALIVPCIVLSVSRDDEFKVVLGCIMGYLKATIIFCISNMIYADTFDRQPFECYMSLLLTVSFVIIEWLMCYCTVSEQTPVVYGWYVTAKVLMCLMYGYYFLKACYCSWIILKKVYKDGVFSNVTSKEIGFLVYTAAMWLTEISMFLYFFALAPHVFDFEWISIEGLIVHDATLIVYAVISTSLPTRIAQYEALRAHNVLNKTQLNVQQTVDRPLNDLMKEMELILEDEAMLGMLNSEGLRRLERMVQLSHQAVGSLQNLLSTQIDDDKFSTGFNTFHASSDKDVQCHSTTGDRDMPVVVSFEEDNAPLRSVSFSDAIVRVTIDEIESKDVDPPASDEEKLSSVEFGKSSSLTQSVVSTRLDMFHTHGHRRNSFTSGSFNLRGQWIRKAASTAPARHDPNVQGPMRELATFH